MQKGILNRNVVTNSFKAWMLASRPKTLTGAIAPVLVGGALAAWSFSYLLFGLCLLFAVVMQIDANFVNDYFDYRNGTDRDDRLGPERACAQGWVTPRSMRIAIGLTTLAACAVGLLILVAGGHVELLIVGVLCVLGCFLYTTHLSYMGLGDLLVIIFFGVVPVGFTYYVLTDGQWSPAVTFAGLGMGFATDNLLMVNNYRDIAQDRISGKRTFAVRFGQRATLMAYLWLGIVAAALAEAVLLSIQPFSAGRVWVGLLLPLAYFCFHLRVYGRMKRLQGRQLNQVLGATAAGIFIYGVLLAVAVIVVGCL